VALCIQVQAVQAVHMALRVLRALHPLMAAVPPALRGWRLV
jgi:hypothetical protein